MKLVNWYKYKNCNRFNDYCSELVDYYLIMEGSWAGSRDRMCEGLLGFEYEERKRIIGNLGGFSIEEVYNIMCCMLCGVRQYS